MYIHQIVNIKQKKINAKNKMFFLNSSLCISSCYVWGFKLTFRFSCLLLMVVSNCDMYLLPGCQGLITIPTKTRIYLGLFNHWRRALQRPMILNAVYYCISISRCLPFDHYHTAKTKPQKTKMPHLMLKPIIMYSSQKNIENIHIHQPRMRWHLK